MYLRHLTVYTNKKYALHPHILNITHINHISKSKVTRATHCRKQERVKRSTTQECMQILLSIKCEASIYEQTYDLVCNLKKNAIEVHTHIHQYTEEYDRTNAISV
jgi:hypothetical protein